MQNLLLLLLIIINISLLYLWMNTKKKLKVIHKIATKDHLTGLGNRYSFDNYVNKNDLNNKKIITIDGNGLKLVNDNLGHYIGDKAISIIAQKLMHWFPECNNIFRIGGDEFIIVLESITDTTIHSRFLIINDELNKSSIFKPFRLSVSYGISEFENDSDVRDIIIKSDIEMYKQKKLSINRL